MSFQFCSFFLLFVLFFSLNGDSKATYDVQHVSNSVHNANSSRKCIHFRNISRGHDVFKKERFLSVTSSSSARGSKKTWPKFKLDIRNGVAIFISIIGSILANAAGIGGGGMFVPMFNSILQFDTKTATALSQAMITGGALTSFLYNIRLQHPHKLKPVIDYDIALLLEPMLLLGISIGVIFNIVVPSWLISLLLTMLLSYMSWKTIVKGRAIWISETKIFNERRISAETHCQTITNQSTNDCTSEVFNSEIEAVDSSHRYDSACADVAIEENVPHVHNVIQKDAGKVPFLSTSAKLTNLKALIIKETSLIPKRRLFELFIIWILFLSLQIFKGGRSSPSLIGVKTCTRWFWVLVTSQIPICVLSTLFVAYRLRKSQSQTTREDSQTLESEEIHWGLRQLSFYPLLALTSGVFAGLLGIGGGMIIGPLLLEMGLSPQVTAATGGLMVLFSSSMALAQFSILHLIPFDYAIVYGTLCALTAFVGLVGVRVIIKRYGRASVIIIALAVVIATSAIVIVIMGSINAVDEIHNHAYMGFQKLCPATSSS